MSSSSLRKQRCRSDNDVLIARYTTDKQVTAVHTMYGRFVFPGARAGWDADENRLEWRVNGIRYTVDPPVLDVD